MTEAGVLEVKEEVSLEPVLEVAPELEPELEPEIVEVAPVVPAPLPELRYKYQPTDLQGRALGGEQVIVYRTPEELAEKLRDQNIELVRKLRQVIRDNRIGKTVKENIPADADRLETSFEFKPRPLTVDERYTISQDLNDPEKFEEAAEKLFEAQTGAKPQEFRDEFTRQRSVTNQLLARQNAQVFFEDHPEFYPSHDNVETLVDWMIKNGLQPTVKNFEIAQVEMQEAGLLLAPPSVREEVPEPKAAPLVAEQIVPKTPALAEPITRISDEGQPQQRQARVPSGLNSRVASNTGVNPETGKLTLAEVDKMSSEEYRRRLATDKTFSKQVEELEVTRPPRPRRH